MGSQSFQQSVITVRQFLGTPKNEEGYLYHQFFIVQKDNCLTVPQLNQLLNYNCPSKPNP